MFNRIPNDVKPTHNVSKVTYVGYFEYDFSIMLRETRSTTLSIMHDDSLDVESNMTCW